MPTPVDELRRTLSERIAQRITKEILDGTLPAGARLRQNEVAKRYGTSSTPIREAFLLLERGGIVESEAHRGVVIHEPTADELHELNFIRIPLETLATEKAVPRLTAEDIDVLRSIHAAFEDAYDRGDVATQLAKNHAFHLRIYRACGLPRLIDLIVELRHVTNVYTHLAALTFAPFPVWSAEQHAAILEACAAGDVVTARDTMRNHLEKADTVVEDMLKHDGLHVEEPTPA